MSCHHRRLAIRQTEKSMRISSRSWARLVIASTAISLSACGSLHSTYVPDGRRGFVVTCGGFLNSWSSCLVKAGRACGSSGYDMVKGNEEDRAMLIACRLPAAFAAVPLASPKASVPAPQ
jgi:hypothetical protein